MATKFVGCYGQQLFSQVPGILLQHLIAMDEETSTQDSREPSGAFLEEINFPEPGIINLEMIKSAYLEEGQRGETRRLHQLEPVVLERIKTLRLEFKSESSELVIEFVMYIAQIHRTIGNTIFTKAIFKCFKSVI